MIWSRALLFSCNWKHIEILSCNRKSINVSNLGIYSQLALAHSAIQSSLEIWPLLLNFSSSSIELTELSKYKGLLLQCQLYEKKSCKFNKPKANETTYKCTLLTNIKLEQSQKQDFYAYWYKVKCKMQYNHISKTDSDYDDINTRVKTALVILPPDQGFITFRVIHCMYSRIGIYPL